MFSHRVAGVVLFGALQNQGWQLLLFLCYFYPATLNWDSTHPKGHNGEGCLTKRFSFDKLLLFCQEKHIVTANLRLALMPLWVLFCPAELSSVGLIMAVILLGTSRAAQEMGSPWKSRDGWRSADVLFSCLRAFTCSGTAPRQKETGCSNQPLPGCRAEVWLFNSYLPLVYCRW